MKFRLLLLKRWVEDLLMLPLIALGRSIARRRPLSREYETFFFFPFYHVGGAEKVHLQIAQATGNSNCIIFFTRKSHNDLFLDGFRASGCEIRDISRYTDNKWLYFVNIIWRGIVSGYINRQQKKPLVFNGQCNFGYKLSPWVRKDIAQVELIHSLCSFSYIRIPFLPFITRTVMISTIRIDEHIALYRRYGIPQVYDRRIQFIMNGIELPKPKPLPRQVESAFTVLYVGRATPEKRVHLVAQMAQDLSAQPQIRFQFLGDVKDAIPAHLRPNCTFWGNQSDKAVIEKIYRDAHVLVLVSDTEGFPMVVMEAMAHGLAVVATAVGEVPLHVKSGVNGFVIEDFWNEGTVVNEGKDFITRLCTDQHLFAAISANNVSYAYANFGQERFAEEYRRLFSDTRNAFLKR